jgi:uncharacterized protein YkwD
MQFRLLAVGVVLLLAPATATAAPAPCQDTDLMPAAGNLDRVRAAVVCLQNQQRTAHGLKPLTENARLRKAAAGHADEMVADGYFAHDGDDGTSFAERIFDQRYVGPDDAYSIGENLAWGTGDLGTPSGVVDAWMHSPPHRANLLSKGYRDVGVGIEPGVPSNPDAGATYTIDFGAKDD